MMLPKKKKKTGKWLWRLAFKSYLEKKEEIIFAIHKHPILHVKRFGIMFFFGVFIPFGVWFLFPQTVFFTTIWGIIGAIRFLSEFIIWYFEVWLVTNISIVDIDWKGFFEKSATRLEYYHVETITYEINGVWATIFNYGDLIIEKTTGNNIKFKGVFRPKNVVKQLTGYQETLSQLRIFRDHHTLKTLLAEMLHQHVKKNGMPEDTRSDPAEGGETKRN